MKRSQLISESERFLERGDFLSSIKHLNELLEIDSMDADAFLRRGNCFNKMGNHGEALSDFVRAAEIDPKNAIAHNNAGDMYLFLSQFSEATKHYELAVSADCNLANDFIFRANLNKCISQIRLNG